jgi:hypothetical protein
VQAVKAVGEGTGGGAEQAWGHRVDQDEDEELTCEMDPETYFARLTLS